MNSCEVDQQTKRVQIVPKKYQYNFRTRRQVQRTGVLLVGWAGNNGSTYTAATIANRQNISWMRKGSIGFRRENGKFSFLRFQKANNIRIIMDR